MDQPRPGQPSGPTDAVAAAIARGDLERAASVLSSLPQPWDPSTLRLAAQVELARHRWAEAQAILEKFDSHDTESQVRLNLARNLAAIQRCRPDLYETLRQPAVGGRYQLARTPSGELAIVAVGAGNAAPRPVSVSPNPRAHAQAIMGELAPSMAADKTIGITGIGDGHLLMEVSRSKTSLLYDQTVAVHVFEPDAELVLHCLMMHDYTGADGPIRDGRFQWFVGAQWQAQFEKAVLHQQPMLSPPQVAATPGAADPAISAGIAAAIQNRAAYELQLRKRVRLYYERMSDGDLAGAFSDHPGHRPRVVILTSRFTTVLRYSAAEAAEAFKALGWETHVIVEPAAHHRMLLLGVLEALDRIKPDLFFTLDHLRFEQGESFPPGLPYVCWLQDLMPNLTTPAAGVRVGTRDFVMSFCRPLLTDAYRYPERQVIDVPMMMAKRIARPQRWESDGPDLAYVSHLSAPRAALREAVVTKVPDEAQTFVGACCDAVFAEYDAGRAVPSMYDVGALVDRVAGKLKVPAEFRKGIIDLLWNPLNIASHRQQALGWAVRAAGELKLELAIYGNGWESHPDFAKYARGPIDAGAPLEALARSARINLNLEPYPCTTHSRLLNGLVAGGFYLVREHPANLLLPELAAFLDRHADPRCESAEEVRRSLGGKVRQQFDALLSRAAGVSFTSPPEPVKQLRAYQRAGVVEPGQSQLLPHLDEVSFRDAASCRKLIERFIGDAEARERIAAAQRVSIEERLSVHRGIDRVVRWIGELLESQSRAVSARELPGALPGAA